MTTATQTKARIVWNGQGGKLDSVVVHGDEYAGTITKALIKMLQGQIVTPGDSFEIREVE